MDPALTTARTTEAIVVRGLGGRHVLGPRFRPCTSPADGAGITSRPFVLYDRLMGRIVMARNRTETLAQEIQLNFPVIVVGARTTPEGITGSGMAREGRHVPSRATGGSPHPRRPPSPGATHRRQTSENP